MASANTVIRVLIADDQPFARQGLELLLRTEPYLEVIGSGSSFADLCAHPEIARCDVVLLDLGRMGAGPIVMVTQLVRAFPQSGIVIFSSSVDMAPELLQAGALAYVAKDDAVEHLVAAIRAAHAGQSYHSPVVKRYLERTAGRRKAFRLAPKELEVLKLLAQGHGTTEIATQMYIDGRTVHNYVYQLFRKTGCQDRQQLIRWYQQVYTAGPEPM